MKTRVLALAVVAVALFTAGQAQGQMCTATLFNDVHASMYPAPMGELFCGWIEWFSGLGITSGCQAEDPAPGIQARYCPNDYVTRAQMAVFVSKAMRGGHNNSVTDDTETVGGGSYNTASNWYSTVGGGYRNIASGGFSTVAGGSANTASANSSTVGGGVHNTAGGSWSTVAGGSLSAASGDHSTVGGGSDNFASGDSSTVGGGIWNTASSRLSTVPGGFQASAERYGQMAYASGCFNENPACRGKAQASWNVLRNVTTDGNPKELFLDGEGQTERIKVGLSRTMTFEVLVVARSATGVSAGFKMWGVIKNYFGTTTMFGQSGQVFGREDGSWNAVVAPDDLNDALVVIVNGSGGQTVRWVATVQTAEVVF